MKLEQSFEVAAPLERVWEALIDVERVAPCLPGASVNGRNDDGSYSGEFKVKIGPTSAAYSGKLHMENIDAEGHRATMQASGTDRRGQGGAKATIVSSVEAGGDGQTRVDVSTDYHITGRLARFGRGGMIEEISNRLLGDFATNLQAMLAGGEGEPVAAETPPAEAPPTAAVAEEALAGESAAAEEPAAGEAEPAAGEPETAAREPETAAGEPETAAAAAAAAAAEVEKAEAQAHEADQADEEPDAVMEGATPVSTAAEAEPSAPSPADSQAPTGPPPGAATGGQTPPPPPRPAPESEPISALSLVGSVAVKRAKENPAPLIAMVLGFLAALRLLRRRS